MALRAVVFDLGGVLEITPATLWQERWALDLGIELMELQRRLQGTWHDGSLGLISLQEVEHRTAIALGLDESQLTAFMSDLWSEYLGSLNEELATYFTQLRPRFRTGILSNSFVGARERERHRYGFESMCDAIVYSHEEAMAKPDPRFYEVVCVRLGVTPDQTVLLDDSEVCIAGARKVGMTTILYQDNDQAIGKLSEVLGSRGGTL